MRPRTLRSLIFKNVFDNIYSLQRLATKRNVITVYYRR
jgi:hypothetical protein